MTETVRIVEELVTTDLYHLNVATPPQGVTYEVPATSEEIVRWEAAAAAWKRAQAEMGARFKEAEEIADAVYEVGEMLRHEEYEKARQEREAQSAAQEALADQVDGPREWVAFYRRRSHQASYTVHHVSCSVVVVAERKLREALLAPNGLLPDRMRLPEVAGKVAQGKKWRSYRPCGRCAQAVVAAADKINLV